MQPRARTVPGAGALPEQMRNAEGSLSEQSPLELLRSLHRERRSGVLELRGENRSERLFFLAGQLHLPVGHPLAGQLGGPESRQAARGLATSWRDWTEGSYSFAEGEDKVAAERVGPLPTALLLMEAAAAGQDEFQLLRQLGGQDREFVAMPPEGQAALDLDPHEAFFLSRLERPTAVKKLLRQVDLGRREALERLCRLQAADLIRPREEAPEAAPEAAVARQLIDRFSERFKTDLRRKPLMLETEEHRRRLKDLMQRLGELNHYELLDVPLGARVEQIHDAYSELARLVHPSHSRRLGLGDKMAGLELLFERVTEAYLTLSDPERTRAYLDRVGGALVSEQFRPSPEKRRQELRDIAAEKYRLAVNYAAHEEYHYAIQQLEQALEVDARPEYWVLLGECQERNPRWLERALDSYSQAVQLNLNDPELRCRLAGCYEKLGRYPRAREEYEAALERMPGFPDAVTGLKRVANAERGRIAGSKEGGGGWLAALLARFRGGG